MVCYDMAVTEVTYEVVTEDGRQWVESCPLPSFQERLGVHSMRGETVRFQTMQTKEVPCPVSDKS